MIRALNLRYRIPEGQLGRISAPTPSGNAGFFRFGSDILCYGQCASGTAARIRVSALYDAAEGMRFDDSGIHLPFDPEEVIENLRQERYEMGLMTEREKILSHEWMLNTYYFVRQFLPAAVRQHLQRTYLGDWKSRPFPTWPVDSTVDMLHEEILRLLMKSAGKTRVPFIWFWPEGARGCLIMTHDVETTAGRDFTSRLMDLDESYGFKASFQVIPEERYEVPDGYVQEIRDRGFEFNIHDLNHDGRLYRKLGEFLDRAKRINEYVHRYNARGFRAGAMHRLPDWYDAYDFSYDMSMSSVAHLEPKRGGCCTVFPFFIGKILELPLTTTQDYSVFHILKDHSIDLWKKQLHLIRQRHGLMSFIAHPDYLISPQNRKVYESLLDYLRRMVARKRIWAALPGEVDLWWRARSQMKLVPKGLDWEIEGAGKDRARIAYAVLDGDRLTYEVPGASS